MITLRLALRRRVAFLRQTAAYAGLEGAMALQFAWDWNRLIGRFWSHGKIREVQVRPKGYRASVTIRIGSSDFEVFQQVFMLQQYLSVTGIEDPQVIVDCGANVGYSALFFLEHFPRARVIALEPDPVNAEHCRRNVRQYGDRIVIMQKAIWGSATKLAFVEDTRKPGAEWGIEVHAATANGVGDMVEAIDIPSLMKTIGAERIDLLKIDIEKSESDVFQNNPSEWLPRVRNIAIELHGPTCEEIFRSAMSPYSFSESLRGEVTLCFGITPARG